MTFPNPANAMLMVLVLLLTLFSSELAADGPAIEKRFDVKFESPLLLTYGSVKITQQDLDTYLSAIPEDVRNDIIIRAEALGEVLTNIYLADVFLLRAQEEDLLLDPAFQSRIYSSLAREVRSVYREKYLSEIALEDYTNSAREIYLTEPELFRQEESVDFFHIALPVRNIDEETEVLRVALRAHDLLVEGADFSAVAERLGNEDGFKIGEVQFDAVSTSELLPQLGAMLAQIDRDQISPPVRSRYGWHVVQLLDVNEGTALSWDEAKDRAVSLARERHRARSWERLLREVLDADFEIVEGAIAEVRERYGIPSADAIDGTQIERALRSLDEDES